MKVYTLHEIGYGEVDGFCGANCHHDWDPYYEGISTPNYTKEELDEMNAANIEYKGKMYTEYQISQMQQYRERHIRELKRQTAKAQDIVDFTDNPELKATAQANYQATASRLKKAEQGLKDFCKATGRDREKSREQVIGFSHSEAQRAVHAAKNNTEDLIFNRKSSKIKIEVFVPAKSVKSAEDFAKTKLGIPNVSYKDVDITTANEWNKGLFDSFSKFPELKKNFGFIGECHERNKLYQSMVEQNVTNILMK